MTKKSKAEFDIIKRELEKVVLNCDAYCRKKEQWINCYDFYYHKCYIDKENTFLICNS